MTQYKLADRAPSSIVFQTGNPLEEPILKISEEGFWVRGVKIEQDDKEAQAVYNAFKEWMVWSSMTRSY
jgi:hypothetical protein